MARGRYSGSNISFLGSFFILPAHCEVDCSAQPCSPSHRKPTPLRPWAKINSSYVVYFRQLSCDKKFTMHYFLFFFFHFGLNIMTMISSMKNVDSETLGYTWPGCHDYQSSERTEIQVQSTYLRIYVRVLWKSSAMSYSHP